MRDFGLRTVGFGLEASGFRLRASGFGLRARGLAAALTATLVLLTAGRAKGEELTVFAASSLREAFSDLARQFEGQHQGVSVALQFAGSQELRVQLDNGASADVFASADEKQMALLSGLAPRPQIFAHNQPVLIVPRDNPAGLRVFADLPRARRIVLGATEVPIGAYSDRILAAAHLDLGSRVVSRELNVRQVLAKVELGEADAAIVYRTDAARKGVQIIPIPPELNVTALYPIALLAHARQPGLAAQFIELVRSPAGGATLARFGFLP